ncbi:hypothetical protein [Priestia aryabhattai]|uniref:hypothetical protein n=1 Tax=Priestia aryabhattai TaxID=412384 RepID=UPI0024536678|nr:hypothetical protein [Priestia aryabhattai]MDH3113121.1 hypothetical protein [Priestia aryabhattai]MDH3127975.1 hypothetical protein [Priestia aryabhattai]
MNENVFQPSVNEDGEKGFFISELDTKGLNFTTKEQRKAYKKRLEKEHNRNNVKFTNTNMNEIDYICENLTNAQIGYLMVLQCYIDYKGTLVHSQKNRTPLKPGDFQKILGLVGKRQTFYDFKNTCLDVGILNYDGLEKAYSINKKFIFKGAFKGMGMDVISMVTKEMKEISEALKPTDLAILFKLQKYVHINSMALVRNPNETNKKKIETLKAADLVDILGVSKNYIYSRLPKLTYNGQALIAQVKAGKKKSYMLNPNVFFRGDYAQIQEDVTHPNGVFFNA